MTAFIEARVPLPLPLPSTSPSAEATSHDYYVSLLLLSQCSPSITSNDYHSSYTMATNGDAPTAGSGTEKINTDIVTLTRFLTEEQTKHHEATGDFT